MRLINAQKRFVHNLPNEFEVFEFCEGVIFLYNNNFSEILN